MWTIRFLKHLLITHFYTLLQKELEAGTTAVKLLIFQYEKKNQTLHKFKEHLRFMSHFFSNLINFYFEFSKEAMGYKSLKHTFLTISLNVIKTQNLYFQYFINYKSKYNHVPWKDPRSLCFSVKHV